MKIKSIKRIGKKPVYDLSVDQAQHYILEDGTVSHNTGIYYSSSAIWIIGRQQNKDGKEVEGYNFVINIEKSRYVREKSKLSLEVSWEEGINKWSGLFDLALELGLIISPTKGWYSLESDPETKFRKSDKENDSVFWEKFFQETNFKTLIKERFAL